MTVPESHSVLCEPALPRKLTTTEENKKHGNQCLDGTVWMGGGEGGGGCCWRGDREKGEFFCWDVEQVYVV